MSERAREVIQDIFRAAIRRVDAGDAVRNALHVEPGGRVRVGSLPHDASIAGIYLIAIGKAALPMLAAAESSLGTLVRDALAVTKQGGPSPSVCGHVLFGAHPTPDDRSFAAGEAVLSFAESVTRGALVLCLISGGGSALVEAARTGVSPTEIQRVTGELLRSGATIEELNAVRSRLSRIKGGGLLNALAGCEVVNVIVSDVLGDSPQVIASGPTTPPETNISAEGVLTRLGVECGLPPPERMPRCSLVTHSVVANNSIAIDAAVQRSRARGFDPFVLSRAVEGEAREVGLVVATIVAEAAAGRNDLPRRCCCIAGGEMVVTVHGDGAGGRNTEAALAAAIRLSGTSGVTIGFLATDGDDASTGVAGAIVDGESIVGSEMIARARAALARNDSATFLRDRSATWETGLTGTNVNDLIIAICEPS